MTNRMPWLSPKVAPQTKYASAPSNLEAALPSVPGFVFKVAGSGPFTLTATSGTRSATIEVEDDNFPSASWELLIQKFLKELS